VSARERETEGEREGALRDGRDSERTPRNNRRKREYRRETYEVDLPPHCARRRTRETPSCHVGRHERHRPGLAIPLAVDAVPEQREGTHGGSRGTLYPLLRRFTPDSPPREGFPGAAACVRARYTRRDSRATRASIDARAGAISTHTLARRVISCKDRGGLPLLEAESRARKRPSRARELDRS